MVCTMASRRRPNSRSGAARPRRRPSIGRPPSSPVAPEGGRAGEAQAERAVIVSAFT